MGQEFQFFNTEQLQSVNKEIQALESNTKSVSEVIASMRSQGIFTEEQIVYVARMLGKVGETQTALRDTKKQANALNWTMNIGLTIVEKAT